MHHCHRGVIYEPDPDGPIPQPCPTCYCPRCDQRWATCQCQRETTCTTTTPSKTTKGH